MSGDHQRVVFLIMYKLMTGRISRIQITVTNLFRKGIIFIALVLQITLIAAQSMRVISTKDGLPQSFVSGLIQDDSSFVWIGTHNGLARFDGINYEIFQHDPFDSASLSSNLVAWIQKAPDNKLWIEYETGEIDVMDMDSETVRHYLKGNAGRRQDMVRFTRGGWLVDSDSLFWGILYPTGLNYYNRRTNEVKG